MLQIKIYTASNNQILPLIRKSKKIQKKRPNHLPSSPQHISLHQTEPKNNIESVLQLMTYESYIKDNKISGYVSQSENAIYRIYHGDDLFFKLSEQSVSNRYIHKKHLMDFVHYLYTIIDQRSSSISVATKDQNQKHSHNILNNDISSIIFVFQSIQNYIPVTCTISLAYVLSSLRIIKDQIPKDLIINSTQNDTEIINNTLPQDVKLFLVELYKIYVMLYNLVHIIDNILNNFQIKRKHINLIICSIMNYVKLFYFENLLIKCPLKFEKTKIMDNTLVANLPKIHQKLNKMISDFELQMPADFLINQTQGIPNIQELETNKQITQ
jgi:hypothetical protein